MVSAVDLLWLVSKLQWVLVSRGLELMRAITSPSKHFMMEDTEATGLRSLKE